MMDYIELLIPKGNLDEYIFDILAERLAEIGFESFEQTEKNFTAYISEKKFEKKSFITLLKHFEYAQISDYEINKIISKDWNEEWEKNFFQPVLIDNKCVIRSSFHQEFPKAEYEIVIDPKMAFGTGHHQTTGLMIRFILENDFSEKNVLDMGCGTAILAILASLRTAKKALAIDIDEWCVRNSEENISLNNIKNIEVLQGDCNVLKNSNFDIILANINRNILLADMFAYSVCLGAGGLLFVSGFYSEDLPLLVEKAEKCNLQLIDTKEDKNWMAIKFQKKS
jgi:ribosomal protein L11 methyltransferase